MFKFLMVLALSTFATMTLCGAPLGTVMFGINDTKQDGDFTDLVFTVEGKFKLVAGCAVTQPTCNAAGIWMPMVNPNGDLNPFWDGFSLDGPNMGIGNLILGNGGFTGNPASPNWSLLGTQYFGAPGGTAGGFYLAPEDGGGVASTTLNIEVAGLSNQNTLMYALASDPLTYMTIFSGPTSAGATYNLTINEPILFAFSNGSDPIVTSDGTMQIAAFQQAVPEPATYALIGAGLIGIAALRRRKT